MKNKFISYVLTLAAVSASALCVSCTKNDPGEAPSSMIKLTLHTEKVVDKTELSENGTVPLWSVGDNIGVISEHGEIENRAFANTETKASRKTEFEGEVSAIGRMFAYYPYNASAGPDGTYISIPLSSLQTVRQGTFDGTCDVLVSKEFEMTQTQDGYVQTENLAFKRLSSVLRLKLRNNFDDPDTYKDEAVKYVSVTTQSNDLAGDLKIDYKTYIAHHVENGSKTVKADYGNNAYAIGGSGSDHITYFSVCPNLIEAGQKLSFEVKTDSRTYQKDIILQKALNLETGEGVDLIVGLKGSTQKGIPYFYGDNWGTFNEMGETSVGSNVWTWHGELSAWDPFHFTIGKHIVQSGYMRDQAAAEYLTATAYDASNYQPFIVGMKTVAGAPVATGALLPSGPYTVTLNLGTNKVSLVHDPITKFYIYDWSWGGGSRDATQSIEMAYNETTGLYEWNGLMGEATKFPIRKAAAEDYWTGFFRDTTAGTNPSKLKLTSVEKMFSASVDGMDGSYGTFAPSMRVSVNPSTLEATFVPRIWIIGSAVAAGTGWDHPNGVEMTYEGNGVYTLTTLLHAYPSDFRFAVAGPNISSGTEIGGNPVGYITWEGYSRCGINDDYWKAIKTKDKTTKDPLNWTVGLDGDGDLICRVKLNILTHDVSVKPITSPIGNFDNPTGTWD